MIDKITFLKTEYGKFPMAFTINVMEAIQSEYESMEGWSKLTMLGNEPNFKALKFCLMHMINDAYKTLKFFGNSKEFRQIDSDEAGLIATAFGMKETIETMGELIQKSLPEVQNTKNAKTTQSPRK